MNRSTHKRVVVVCLAALLGLACHAQPVFAAEIGAVVDESLVNVVLRVDNQAENASDAEDNPGTDAARPLRSFARAGALAQEHLNDGRGVRIELAPGLYREQVEIAGPWTEEGKQALLVVQGSSDGATILSGAVIEGFEADTWRPVPGHPNVYEHDWDRQMGLHAGPWANLFDDHDTLIKGAAQRGELLIVNDRIARQVVLESYDWVDPDGPAGLGASREENNKPGELVYQGVVEAGLGALDAPWTFAVADHDASPESLRHRLFLRLPDGVTPADLESIEVGAPSRLRQEWPTALRPSPLFIGYKDNIVVRGLTVRHGGTFLPGAGLHLAKVNHALIEDCVSSHNGGVGLKVSGWGGGTSRVTIRNCKLNDNGYAGLRPPGVQSLVEDTEFSFNNWRGAWGGFYGVDAAGMKVGNADQLVFRRCVAIGNRTHGFWDDVFCKGVVYDRCLAYANYRMGFFIELSGDKAGRGDAGDALATSCVAVGNGTSGIRLLEYRRPVVENCVAAFNYAEQLMLMDFAGRQPNGAEGVEFIRIRNSHFISDDQAPLVSVMGYGELDFLNALEMSGNTYATSSGTLSFKKGQHILSSWSDWRKAITDAGATLSDERVDRIAPRWDAASVLLDPDSPVVGRAREMGVPLPRDLIERGADMIRARTELADRLIQQPEYHRPWPLVRESDEPRFTIVDLSPFANYDVQAGNGVIRLNPGWYAGLDSIYGVPVSVSVEGEGALAMPSKAFPEDASGQPLPAEVTVPIERKARALYVLHGASYVGKQEAIGAYELVYGDGSTHEVAVTATAGWNNNTPRARAAVVKDWFHNPPLRGESVRPAPAVIQSTLESSSASVYQWQIVNPAPEKTIEALRIKADMEGHARVIVFAVTVMDP